MSDLFEIKNEIENSTRIPISVYLVQNSRGIHDYMFTCVITGLNRLVKAGLVTYHTNSTYFTNHNWPVYTAPPEQIVNEESIITDPEMTRLFFEKADVVLFLCNLFPGSPDNKPLGVVGLVDEDSKSEDESSWLSKAVYIDGTEYSYRNKPVNSSATIRRISSATIRRISSATIRRISSQGDDTDIMVWNYVKKHAKGYAKRECTQEHVKNGITPFPFSCVETPIDSCLFWGDKDIDISCCFGQDCTGLRRGILQALKGLKQSNPNLSIFIGSGLDKHEEYIKIMRRSKIVIDGKGGGESNMRLYEAVSSGCLVFREKYSIVVKDDFTEEEIEEYSSVKECVEKLLKACLESGLIREKAEKSLIRLKQFHTCEKRVWNLIKGLTPNGSKP